VAWRASLGAATVKESSTSVHDGSSKLDITENNHFSLEDDVYVVADNVSSVTVSRL
jgi:hypothetical protein